jgi:hypothetical protein
MPQLKDLFAYQYQRFKIREKIEGVQLVLIIRNNLMLKTLVEKLEKYDCSGVTMYL